MNKSYRQKKPMAAFKRKQNGVVLISCIVFLLLILGLLKISLSSSQISEQKAGIDADLELSRQNAQLAIRQAELAILSVIDKNDLSNCKKSKKSDKCLKDYKKAVEMVWTKAAKNSSDTTMPDAFKDFTTDDQSVIASKASELKKKDGMHHFDYKNTASLPAQCQTKPIWRCGDWGNAFPNNSYKDTNLKTVEVTAIGTGNVTAQENKIDIPPRYMIEWFLPSEVDMDTNKGSVIFRITGVGFGQSIDGSTDGVTHAAFQANYVL